MGPSLSLLFFPAIVIPATYGGYGPALLATVLSTTSLAFFFVPPGFSFNIGLGDFIRLSVFATVAVITAAISSARKRAEDELRLSLADLQDVNATLRKVSEWPVAVGVDASETAREMLEHAAGIVSGSGACHLGGTEEPGSILRIHANWRSADTDPPARFLVLQPWRRCRRDAVHHGTPDRPRIFRGDEGSQDRWCRRWSCAKSATRSISCISWNRSADWPFGKSESAGAGSHDGGAAVADRHTIAATGDR
jgi:hypothetical protein